MTLFTIVLLLWAVVPEGGVLRDPDTGSILRSSFISGIVVIIALWAGLAGIAFGRVAGTFSNGAAVVDSMERTMTTMATYLVLMFFAAQFVAWFGWTNLGVILAIVGADGLRVIDPGPVTLMLLYPRKR